MKQTAKILATGLLAISLFSCRNNDHPEDTHEHDSIDKVVLTLTENETKNTQTVTFKSGNGADKSLVLENGKTYNANLQFFGHHDGKEEDMTEEIAEEKDHHFVQYGFAGVSVNITRTAEDTARKDGKKLGLKTQWKVTAAPEMKDTTKVVVELIHEATEVDDTANSGSGSHKGGEIDAAATFHIK